MPVDHKHPLTFKGTAQIALFRVEEWNKIRYGGPSSGEGVFTAQMVIRQISITATDWQGTDRCQA